MTIQELLKTWADLEPSRCRALSRIECYAVKINKLEHDLFFPENAKRIQDDCLSLAFKAAMQGIEESGVLRICLENDGQTWHSSLADLTLTPPEDNLPIVPRFLGSSKAHELAVLRSYVQWLKYKHTQAALEAVEGES